MIKLENDLSLEWVDGNLKVIFLAKESAPCWADLSNLTTRVMEIERWHDKTFSWESSKAIFWVGDFKLDRFMRLEDTFTLPHGKLEIYQLYSRGNSIPDIATYWVALMNDIPVSVRCRPDMWRSEDYIYGQWVESLKMEYSVVEEEVAAV